MSLARIWWVLALRGVLAVLFGLIAFFWPGITLVSLIYLFGAYALIDGIFAVLAAFNRMAGQGHWWATLIEGVAGILAGVAAFVWPGLTALALVYLIAAWAIVTGVLEIAAAIRLRREISGEWLLVLGGIVSMLFGLYAVAFPGAGLALVWAIGAYALFWGIVLIALGFGLRGRHTASASDATDQTYSGTVAGAAAGGLVARGPMGRTCPLPTPWPRRARHGATTATSDVSVVLTHAGGKRAGRAGHQARSAHRLPGEVRLDVVGRDHVAGERLERAVLLEPDGDVPHRRQRGPHQGRPEADPGDPGRSSSRKGCLGGRREHVDRRPDRLVDPLQRVQVAEQDGIEAVAASLEVCLRAPDRLVELLGVRARHTGPEHIGPRVVEERYALLRELSRGPP